MALDRGETPYVVAEADGVERVQRVGAEAQAGADRLERRGAFTGGTAVPSLAELRAQVANLLAGLCGDDAGAA